MAERTGVNSAKVSIILLYKIYLICGKKNRFFLAIVLCLQYLCKLNNDDTVMTTGNLIRFACILLLWLGLCWLLLTRAARIDFMVIFTIVASGIIIFVPLYKKYVRNKD